MLHLSGPNFHRAAQSKGRHFERGFLWNWALSRTFVGNGSKTGPQNQTLGGAFPAYFEHPFGSSFFLMPPPCTLFRATRRGKGFAKKMPSARMCACAAIKSDLGPWISGMVMWKVDASIRVKPLKRAPLNHIPQMAQED